MLILDYLQNFSSTLATKPVRHHKLRKEMPLEGFLWNIMKGEHVQYQLKTL